MWFLCSFSGRVIDYKLSAHGNLDGHGVSEKLDGRCDSDLGHNKDEKSSEGEKASLTKEKQLTVSSSTGLMPKEVKHKSQVHAETFASANSTIGVYSSSLDPVHVPSSTRGAIRREVGVVGLRRWSSDYSGACVSNSSNSFVIPLSEKDFSSSRHNFSIFKSNNPSYVSKPIIPSTSFRKAFCSSQYDVKQHHQVMGRNKGHNF